MTDSKHTTNDALHHDGDDRLDSLLTSYAARLIDSDKESPVAELDVDVQLPDSMWSDIAAMLDSDGSVPVAAVDESFIAAYVDAELDYGSPEVVAFEQSLSRNPKAVEAIQRQELMSASVQAYAEHVETACAIDVVAPVMARYDAALLAEAEGSGAALSAAPSASSTTDNVVSFETPPATPVAKPAVRRSKLAWLALPAAAAAALMLVFTNINFDAQETTAQARKADASVSASNAVASAPALLADSAGTPLMNPSLSMEGDSRMEQEQSEGQTADDFETSLSGDLAETDMNRVLAKEQNKPSVGRSFARAKRSYSNKVVAQAQSTAVGSLERRVERLAMSLAPQSAFAKSSPKPAPNSASAADSRVSARRKDFNEPWSDFSTPSSLHSDGKPSGSRTWGDVQLASTMPLTGFNGVPYGGGGLNYSRESFVSKGMTLKSEPELRRKRKSWPEPRRTVQTRVQQPARELASAVIPSVMAKPVAARPSAARVSTIPTVEEYVRVFCEQRLPTASEVEADVIMYGCGGI